MSNELITQETYAIIDWKNAQTLTEIKKICSQTPLSDVEFSCFVALGKSTGLNPFLREMWAVKYGNSAAQIFVGRDGYRKAAQKNPQYDYHQSEAVYSNDDFKVCNGEINHSYGMQDRGELIGAYCIVKRHGSSRPIYTYVSLKEYDTKQSVWKTKPATMIKKVAEAQGLRAAFQEQLGGTYAEEEEYTREPKKVVGNYPPEMSTIERVKQSYSTRKGNSDEHMSGNEQDMCDISEGETIENSIETNENIIINEVGETRIEENQYSGKNSKAGKCTQEQIVKIEGLTFMCDFPPERMRKALNHYGVAIIPELNSEQADEFIDILIREDK